MKKNLQTITLLLTIIAAFSLGCKMLGGTKLPVSNEQLSDDLKNMSEEIRGTGGVMSKDLIDTQCLKVLESKFEGDLGELLVDYFVQNAGNTVYGFGQVAAKYKKNGDKWTIQSVTPKGFKVKMPLDQKDSDEIVKKGAELCSNYDSKKKSK